MSSVAGWGLDVDLTGSGVLFPTHSWLQSQGV